MVSQPIASAANVSLRLEPSGQAVRIRGERDELVQLVLVGQPELRALIMRPEMKQFMQRVGSSFHLSAMSKDNVAAYIAHRLRVAGGTGEEFAQDAVSEVYRLTSGIPRLVNQLCDLGLVYAFSSEESVVTAETIDCVLADGVFFGAPAPGGEAAHES